uniref:Uncharacterized protein n=1 Tax=Romanomermis culicivorax TaxID=13658 RepID=A0A915JRQ0_ROMCU
MAHLYLPFPTERNGSSTAWNVQREKPLSVGRDNCNLRKTTDGNRQPNRTERKFSSRSVKFGRLHSVSSEKASINELLLLRQAAQRNGKRPPIPYKNRRHRV